MATTVTDFTQDIANVHDIDLDTARHVVQVHVDQIAADRDLYDPETQALTDEGVQVVSQAIHDSDSQQLWSTTAHNLLNQLDAVVERITNTQNDLDGLVADRDQIIRKLMTTEVPRDHIATVAGLKPARLYQIRDGRR